MSGAPTSRASEPPAYAALRRFENAQISLPLEDRHLSRRLAHIDKERVRELLNEEVSEDHIERMRDTSVPLRLNFSALQYITSRFDVVWPREPTR